MVKILTVILIAAAWASADDQSGDLSNNSSRQKRLLFFDEDGALVKTFPNPYMNQVLHNAQELPFYGNFLNPFFSFIRAFGNNLAAFAIPVSNAIIQQIRRDPNFQNSLIVIPKKELVVEPNPLCAGKRTQIPAPNLCSNFLNCWDGWAFEQECPTGLMFSSNGYCDYAENVDCQNRQLDENKPQPQPVCSRDDFEAIRNPLNCNEFFICVNRQPVVFKCPADLAYSQDLGVCDYPDRVDCKSTGSPIIAPAPQPILPDPSPVVPSSPSVSPPGPQVIPAPQFPESPAASPEIPPASISKPPLSSILPAGTTGPDRSAPSLFPSFPSVFPLDTTKFPSRPSVFPLETTKFPSRPSVFPLDTTKFPSRPSVFPPDTTKFPSRPSVFPLDTTKFPDKAMFPDSPAVPSPLVISQLTSERPLAPVSMLPAAPMEGLVKPGDKPVFPGSSILAPGCSSANVAMSRQDAIRLLQQAHNSY